jgi:hypothetical protein
MYLKYPAQFMKYMLMKFAVFVVWRGIRLLRQAGDVTRRWTKKTPDTDLVVLPLLGQGLRLTATAYPRAVWNCLDLISHDVFTAQVTRLAGTHLIHSLVIVKNTTHAPCRTPPLLRENFMWERGWLSWKPSPANWSGPPIQKEKKETEGYLSVSFIDEM